jgi:transposase
VAGVPLLLRLDNLKAAVKHPDSLDPFLNPKFAEFCRHYQIKAVPCRPYYSQREGKVEHNIAHVKNNALKRSEVDLFTPAFSCGLPSTAQRANQ